jgi:hypothetical protein
LQAVQVADRALVAAVDSSSWPKIKRHRQAIGQRIAPAAPATPNPVCALTAQRRQNEPQVQVAADAVVQVGHQFFALVTIKPAQLDQFRRAR